MELSAAKLKLEGETVVAPRREHAVLRLESLLKWLQSRKQELLPKRSLAQPANYALNQRAALMRYEEDGALSIGNNLSE